jgi:hypothetical protein
LAIFPPAFGNEIFRGSLNQSIAALRRDAMEALYVSDSLTRRNRAARIIAFRCALFNPDKRLFFWLQSHTIACIQTNAPAQVKIAQPPPLNRRGASLR